MESFVRTCFCGVGGNNNGTVLRTTGSRISFGLFGTLSLGRGRDCCRGGNHGSGCMI